LDKWWTLRREDQNDKKIVEELGFQTLGDDVLKYRSLTSPVEYPALQYPHPNLDWDEWFNRPVDEKCLWLFIFLEGEVFTISLRKVTLEKRRELCRLKVADDQCRTNRERGMTSVLKVISNEK
jgi:hypothetical protein